MKNKKAMKRAFSVSATILMACSALCTSACAPNNSESDSTTNVPQGSQSKYDLSGTTHIYDVTDGNNDLVKNGQSEYTIVYPAAEAEDENMTNAIAELKSLFYEATNITLPVLSDANCTKTEKILSVGQTQQAMAQESVAAGLEYELGRDGFIIESEGSAVYMLGNTTVADMYSVYEFLKWQFDFEHYAVNVYTLTKNVRDMKQKDFHVVDIPDILQRQAAVTQSPKTYPGTGNRLRYNRIEDMFATGEYCHNQDELLAEYRNEHPSWFSTSGYNLCVTARGDEKEYEAMIEALTNAYIERLIEDPTAEALVFCEEDMKAWCSCPACTKDNKLYDSPTTNAWANTIRLINRVAKNIKVWNEENSPERDIVIYLFDYFAMTMAPVKLDENKQPILDENGNYLPYSEELMMEDNVGVFLCYLKYGNHYEVGSDVDAITTETVKGERAYACMKRKNTFIWTWSTVFADHFLPINSIETRQDYLQYFVSIGAKGILDQGQHDNPYASHFNMLYQYIYSKLMWNTQLDVEVLKANFFKAYFQETAPVMREMYDAFAGYMLYLRDNKGYAGSTQQATAYRTTEKYPYGVIQNFMSYIDRAYGLIEDLQYTNKSKYDKLYKRILLESITWRYLDWKLYPTNYSSEQLSIVQEKWREDAKFCGIINYRERKPLDSMIF